MNIRGLVTFEHRDPGANVLVVTNGWPHDEDSTYCIFVERQVEALRAAGLRCDVLFIRGYRTPGAYLVGAAALFGLSFRRRRYLLVHAHGGEAALAASCYLRAPIVASYLGDDLLGRPRADGSVSLRHRVKRAAIRQHSRLMSRTITKSAAMAGALASDKNSVIPNGVNTTVFRPRSRDEARHALGWGGEPTVLLVANLGSPAQVARKRPWLAEQAVELVREMLPTVRLEIATGVPPEEIATFMNAADCLLLTSSIEGSPNVVKEALMCNLPVVATNVGDVPELLAGVEPSCVVDASPHSIATGVLACLHDGRRSNGRTHAARLSAEHAAHRILEIYGRFGLIIGTAQPEGAAAVPNGLREVRIADAAARVNGARVVSTPGAPRTTWTRADAAPSAGLLSQPMPSNPMPQ